MTRSDLCIECQIQLAEVANNAPATRRTPKLISGTAVTERECRIIWDSDWAKNRGTSDSTKQQKNSGDAIKQRGLDVCLLR
jgi:hypothetical protein